MTDAAIPDFLDPDVLRAGVPHAAYHRLRAEEPVSWRETKFGRPYWLLTRHRDVMDALLDTATFSSWRGATVLEDSEHVEMMRLMLINMDPPSHTRYRRLITRAFAVRAVEKLEPAVRELARGCLERVTRGRSFDFVADVARPLPTRVLFELVGVPEADRDELAMLSDTMIDHANTPEALASAMRMYQYAHGLAETRRAEPRDDLLSHLVQAEVDGEKLSDGEIDAFFLLLVVAGTETTRNLVAGGVAALAEHPDELARVRRDPALLPSAIEEMLRWLSPVSQFRRTVNRDVEWRGRQLREGDKVIVAHAAANRDPEVFADPDRFDVARAPNPHVAFGFGPHLCVGAALARLEARVLFEELLARFERLSLDGPGERIRSNFVNGYNRLPVVVE